MTKLLKHQEQKVKTTNHSKVGLEIVSIDPFYKCQKVGESEVHGFTTRAELQDFLGNIKMNDIANKLIGIDVKTLKDINLEKNNKPYRYKYLGVEDTASSLKDIVNKTGVNLSRVYNIVKEFLNASK